MNIISLSLFLNELSHSGLAAKARSQSPYVPIRGEFERRSKQDGEGSDHRGRSVSRSSSLRKRDSSWDKKFAEQVQRNKEADGGEIMKRETSPGKLIDGLSFWERRIRQQFRLGAL